MAFGAVALDAARRTGESGTSVAVQSLVDRQGEIAVVACRDRSLLIGEFAIMRAMTREQVKEILDRVLTWPAERQADVAHIVELLEEQDKSDLRLTDEQAAEVRRRITEKNPETLTLAEFNEHLRRRYGV